MDLADVSNIRSHNQNYTYLLFVIDVFSRYLWIQPIKDKTSKRVINALKIVLRSRKPNSIKSDKGSEFKNKEVRSFLKKEDIHTFYSQNETKGALVERSIRTIKTALYRYFRHKQTYKYLDVLQDFVRNYNKRPHRSLGQYSPAEVNQDNASEVRYNAYLAAKPRITKTIKKERKITKKERKSSRFKFKTGDLVRITYVRHPFERQKWTEELFIIRHRFLREGIPVYQIKDFEDENIDGTFYQQELQKVNKDEDKAWKIEKILKRRKRRGVEQALVRWLGWPKKFDSWVDVSEIQ